ncbi:hypothetical protein CJ485_25180 [Priestia filamentosa]|nr:hypothetical protein CJ485_25180 [Priestia filamentosa]
MSRLEVYKEEAAVSELESGFYLGSPEEEAINFWMEIAQNFIINVVKVTNNSVKRTFILVYVGKQPFFDTFYQIDGRLVMWNQLEDMVIKKEIENELLPQASTVASLVNDNFAEAEHPKIAFAELQFEWATEAGSSHVIWEYDDHTNLVTEEILSKWFNNLSTEIKTQPLDSNTKLSWYS